MHTEIRIFAGMAGQGGRFAARRAGLEALMRDVPGLEAFQLLETAEGVAAIATCRDAEGAALCARRFAGWVAGELPDLAERETLVVRGAVIALARP